MHARACSATSCKHAAASSAALAVLLLAQRRWAPAGGAHLTPVRAPRAVQSAASPRRAPARAMDAQAGVRAPKGGHDTSLFEGAVPEYALCPVCHNCLDEPRSCPRGHRRARGLAQPRAGAAQALTRKAPAPAAAFATPASPRGCCVVRRVPSTVSLWIALFPTWGCVRRWACCAYGALVNRRRTAAPTPRSPPLRASPRRPTAGMSCLRSTAGGPVLWTHCQRTKSSVHSSPCAAPSPAAASALRASRWRRTAAAASLPPSRACTAATTTSAAFSACPHRYGHRSLFARADASVLYSGGATTRCAPPSRRAARTTAAA